MKKLLFVLLSCVLIFVLIACGADTDSKNNTDETKGTANESTAKETPAPDYTPSAPIDWDEKLAEYKDNAQVKDLVFIRYINGTDATLEYYVKDESEKSGFKLFLTTTADTAKNGIDKQIEGDARTPVGDFGLVRAIGIKENPGTKLDYLQLTDDMYLCNDEPETYNTIIDCTEVEHFCMGSHLAGIAPDYNYAIDIDYNAECEWQKGSGIFLRVRNDKGKKSTGCVATDEESLVKILKNINKGARIIIGR